MKLTRRATFALCIVSAALLAACSSSGSSHSSTGKKIEVLAILPLSGVLSVPGKLSQQAVEAAATVINSSGGVLGKQITVSFQDDKSDATQAAQLLQQDLNSGSKPAVLIDGAEDNEAVAMAPLIDKNKILAISESISGADSLGDEDATKHPTTFSTSPSTAAVAQAGAAYLKAQGYSKVAVIAADDAYGKTWESQYVTAVKADGMTITGTASYADTALDVTPELQSLKATDPDVLLAEAYGAPASYVLKDRLTLGWTSTPMVGAQTFATDDLTKAVDPSALADFKIQALTVAKYVAPSQRSAKITEFIKAIEAHGSLEGTLVPYAYSYDPLILAAAAINKAGSTDGLKAATALENLGTVTSTVIQPHYYTQTMHSPVADNSIFSFIPAGPVVDGQIEGS